MIMADETRLKSKAVIWMNIIGCCFPHSTNWKHFFISVTDCLSKRFSVGKLNSEYAVVGSIVEVVCSAGDSSKGFDESLISPYRAPYFELIEILQILVVGSLENLCVSHKTPWLSRYEALFHLKSESDTKCENRQESAKFASSAQFSNIIFSLNSSSLTNDCKLVLDLLILIQNE